MMCSILRVGGVVRQDEDAPRSGEDMRQLSTEREKQGGSGVSYNDNDGRPDMLAVGQSDKIDRVCRMKVYLG